MRIVLNILIDWMTYQSLHRFKVDTSLRVFRVGRVEINKRYQYQSQLSSKK